MVASSTQLSDIQNHWARLFIESLAQQGIVTGFPDGSFRPNQSMTRVEFAAILNKAFNLPQKRQYAAFLDIPPTHWAAAAIQKAYETQFLSGFPDKRFRPNDRIARVEVLVSLVGGLGITSDQISNLKAALPSLYQDAAQIPSYATDRIALATGAGLVVNYPNLKILNPSGAATRAEVVAFIYQALVSLGQVAKIQSNYIVTLPPVPVVPQTVKVTHKREFRGAWVASVWNLDWPSQSGMTVDQQKTELLNIVKQMQALNFNALILQVRPEGDALYASKLEPWSAWLTGTQGKQPNPLYDPLEFAIAESHKRNIEVHAWFNPYRAAVQPKTTPPVSPHIAVTNPEAVYQWGNQLWMDPGLKVVQDRTYNVIMDVLRRYDVDGIHLDDYFYPYPIAGKTFPDSKTYAAYQAGGGNLTLGDWRRANVNYMVQRLSMGIRATKPQVKFGISPFGIWRPGQPEQIQGLDAYNELYADSRKWLQEGWVDYFAPQLYWRIDQTAQSYPVLLKWWTENNPQQRHIYAGNNLGQLDGQTWTREEIEKQVNITRDFTGQMSLGNIFYSMKALQDNVQGIADSFETGAYAQPALVPTMSWMNATTPATPTGLIFKDGKLNWNEVAGVRSWTLYKQEANTWKLQRILSAGTNFATVGPGNYVVCAVDKIGNESGGIAIAVK